MRAISPDGHLACFRRGWPIAAAANDNRRPPLWMDVRTLMRIFAEWRER